LKGFFGGNHLGDPAGGIIQVAKMHSLPLTADDTEGLKTPVCSMDAKVAFFYLLLFPAVKDGVKRTNLHARLTAIALFFVQNNRAIFSFHESLRWTGIYARRVGAVIAKLGQEIHPQIGKAPLRSILLDHVLRLDANPALCCLVLYLTSHGAGFTSEAPFLVDDQA